MAPIAAAIPVITAIGGLASTGVGLYQAFKKPPSASMPSISSPLMSTAEKRTNSNMKASLISTSPSGLQTEAETSRARLLGN